MLSTISPLQKHFHGSTLETCHGAIYITQFILKHWQNANQSGIFLIFYINPSKASNNKLHLGTLHQWLLGRAEGLQLGRFTPVRLHEKKKSELKSKWRGQVQHLY